MENQIYQKCAFWPNITSAWLNHLKDCPENLLRDLIGNLILASFQIGNLILILISNLVARHIRFFTLISWINQDLTEVARALGSLFGHGSFQELDPANDLSLCRSSTTSWNRV